ncbi:MAG: hypothetical protein ACREPB_14480 [Arenimonas sp.]
MSQHFSMRFTARLLAISTLLLSFSALATEQVTIAETIPYASDDVGTAEIRTQCDWNKRLSAEIVRQSHKNVISTKLALNSVTGPTLQIKIVNVHAAGGGNFSGPKWALLRGELLGAGGEVRSFELRRATTGPMQFTACAALNKIAKALGSDVAVWLKKQNGEVSVAK